MTSRRLAAGGLIDRGKPIRFGFDGRAYTGFSGDTLASALLANGVRLVGRSFKYHRPRGVLTAGSSEPNALVTVGGGGRREPNTRATMAELHDGLAAESQNRWPSLRFDLGAVNGLAGPFIGAGFYYKTFMWPAALWERLYEPMIRRAAGLGRAGYEPDPDRYEKRWAHCDLLVIGAGPAGLSAALVAARSGARVILADEQALPGGALLGERLYVGGVPGPRWAASMRDELAASPNVTLLPRTTVFGWYDSNVFGAVERVQKHVALPDPHRPIERLWRIVARHALLASGAEEQPIPFGGNDRPGTMIAGAMRTYLNRYAVAPGARVAVYAGCDAAYRTAFDLAEADVEVVAVIDPRGGTGGAPPPGVRHLAGAAIVGTRGRRALSGIEIARDGRTERLAVDALAMSNGFAPVIGLACQRGARPVWNEAAGAFLAPETQEGLTVAGAAAGLAGTGEAISDAVAKAAAALAAFGYRPAPHDLPEIGAEPASGGRPLGSPARWRGKAFVDFQNDVTMTDLGIAEREGFRHVEHMKRYTTSGMATDQGKLSNLNAILAVAEATGRIPAEVGTTTHRPFYAPVSFGALAGTSRGRRFQPLRKSPLHDWAKAHGAVFVEAGLWYRSAWFPRPGEAGWRECIDREALNVRANVGICDVSPLGKIELFGSDAATFLDWVYCNRIASLPVGKARYGVMLREDGFIMDDGTVARLGEDHFFVTTTTAAAGSVMAHLEYCAQVLWPELDVRMVSASDEWAQMAVAGPKSRLVLQEVVEDELSAERVPFLAAAQVRLRNGLPARLFRISFSGELAYELSVPAAYGGAVAEAVMKAGATHGIMPYGVEAQSVLRIEKGFVTHAEINGTVTPGDLGMGRMVSFAKDFVGRVMLKREGLQAAGRPCLVGLVPVDPSRRIRAGAHLLKAGDVPSMAADQGHVTSACYSPNLASHIALALLADGPERHGEQLVVWDGLRSETVEARVCPPVFFDPESRRLHV
jgi:sarcosine oxidase subunit alpha